MLYIIRCFSQETAKLLKDLDVSINNEYNLYVTSRKPGMIKVPHWLNACLSPEK